MNFNTKNIAAFKALMLLAFAAIFCFALTHRNHFLKNDFQNSVAFFKSQNSSSTNFFSTVICDVDDDISDSENHETPENLFVAQHQNFQENSFQNTAQLIFHPTQFSYQVSPQMHYPSKLMVFLI